MRVAICLAFPNIKKHDSFTAMLTHLKRRSTYLREHHLITYNRLLLSERLFPHLREVQENAHQRLDSIMSDMLVFNPLPDKAADGLAWAAHMDEVHRAAEKMMLDKAV